RRRIEYEPHLNLVDARTAEYVIVECRKEHTAAGRERGNPERAGADELRIPERELPEARLVGEVRRLEDVLRQRLRQILGEQGVRLDERLRPRCRDGSSVACLDFLQQSERCIAEHWQLAVAPDGDREEQIVG